MAEPVVPGAPAVPELPIYGDEITCALDALVALRTQWARIGTGSATYDQDEVETLHRLIKAARDACRAADPVVQERNRNAGKSSIEARHRALAWVPRVHPFWQYERFVLGARLGNEAVADRYHGIARSKLKRASKRGANGVVPFVGQHPVSAESRRLNAPSVNFMRRRTAEKVARQICAIDSIIIVLCNCWQDVEQNRYQISLAVATGIRN